MRLRSGHIKTLLILLMAFIGAGSIAYTQYLINRLREKERNSVSLWAKAIEYNGNPRNVAVRDQLKALEGEINRSTTLTSREKQAWTGMLDRSSSDIDSNELNFVASELIIKNRFEIPSVITDSTGKILNSRNVDPKNLNPGLVHHLASINPPIVIHLGSGDHSQKQYVYYGESRTVVLLRYFPFFQLGLLSIFLGLAYYSWSSIRKTEQSNVWVGMAREAAHQLGTPLSSLFGWIALLHEKSLDKNTRHIVDELSNDVERLQNVAERFNKIGSAPELQVQPLAPVLEEVLHYIEKRIPRLGKNVMIDKKIDPDIKTALNADLFRWALENIVKNSLDALDAGNESGIISVHCYQQEDQVLIDIADNGKGIEKKYLKDIFKPGYSTKRRGWGLGLSLTRRIIEVYHRGRVFVEKSTPGYGTTFRIVLKSQPEPT